MPNLVKREAGKIGLKHLYKRSEINGLVREDFYDVPEKAIREAIVNAVVHRDYAFQGRSIFVLVFDDRIEIESPGMPLIDMTHPCAGRSEIRNTVLASVFKTIGFIEKYGTGIPRMMEECENQGCAAPEFIETRESLKVIFRRGQARPDPNDLHSVMLECIRSNPAVSQQQISEALGVSVSKVKRMMAKMKEDGIIERKGDQWTGTWVVRSSSRD